jgi:hypothetical protein
MIFLKIFFGVWLVQKNIDGKKRLATIFRRWWLESDGTSHISAWPTGFQQQWLDSGH